METGPAAFGIPTAVSTPSFMHLGDGGTGLTALWLWKASAPSSFIARNLLALRRRRASHFTLLGQMKFETHYADLPTEAPPVSAAQHYCGRSLALTCISPPRTSVWRSLLSRLPVMRTTLDVALPISLLLLSLTLSRGSLLVCQRLLLNTKTKGVTCSTPIQVTPKPRARIDPRGLTGRT